MLPDKAMSADDATLALEKIQRRYDIQERYPEDEIRTLLQYGYQIEDVPVLVGIKDGYHALLRFSAEAYIRLGGELRQVKTGMRYGGWVNYLKWADMDDQFVSRAIGAYELAHAYPQLGTRLDPATTATDDTPHGTMNLSALQQLGQSRDKVTPAVVEEMIALLDEGAVVNVDDVRDALKRLGVAKPPPPGDHGEYEDLHYRRLSGPAAKGYLAEVHAAVQHYMAEPFANAMPAGQWGLILLSDRFQRWGKRLLKNADGPTEQMQEMRMLLLQLFLFYDSGEAAGLLTPYQDTPPAPVAPIPFDVIPVPADLPGVGAEAYYPDPDFDMDHSPNFEEVINVVDEYYPDGSRLTIDIRPDTELVDENGQGYDANELPQVPE